MNEQKSNESNIDKKKYGALMFYKWGEYVIILFALVIYLLGCSYDISNFDSYATFFWIVFFISILVRWFRTKRKCPHCKKYRALVFQERIDMGSYDISILTELKNRNANGDVIGTSEQYIPGTRTYYKEIHKCKYCDGIVYREYKSDTRNI